MQQLVHTHVSNGGSVPSRSGLLPGGSRSLIDMFQEKRKTKPAMEEDGKRGNFLLSSGKILIAFGSSSTRQELSITEGFCILKTTQLNLIWLETCHCSFIW